MVDLKSEASCGNLPELYCLADIQKQAVNIALNTSRSCDEIDNSDSACVEDFEEMYRVEFKKLELTHLSKEKAKLERYIENPVGSRLFNSVNAQGNIYLISEKCKRAAVNRGLRGAAYQKEVKEVCEPSATIEFLTPQIAILKKVVERIEQLGI